MNTWIVQVTYSILGPMVVAARRKGGKYQPADQLPVQLREYLNLPEDRTKPAVMGDVANLEQLDAISLDEILARCTIRGTSRLLTLVLPTLPHQRKPAPIPKGTPAIRSLRQLCTHFDADEPRGLNRRIYKDTDCGASISLLLPDGTWLHNGGAGWDQLTIESKIHGFTIQTIVEGSEATVDSDTFILPVTVQEVDDWMADMEAQADDLWKEANPHDNEDEESEQ